MVTTIAEKKKKKATFELLRLGLFVFVLTLSLAVFTLTPSLMPSFFISVLLFFMITPLIDSLERSGIRRIYAIAAVFLISGIALGGIMRYITPIITSEFHSFHQKSAKYKKSLQTQLQGQEQALIQQFPIFKEAGLATKATSWLQESAQKILIVIPQLASHLAMGIFLIPLLTFFLLKDAHDIRRSLLKLVPNRYFETVYSLTSRILDDMGGYVSARIVEAFLVAILVTLGCLIAKIPYAVLLGIFAGATNAIPYLGPLIGALPGLFFALFEPTVPNQTFITVTIYAISNFVDMTLIFPVLVARIVDLHPLIVVISVILGSQWFGILGMILAVPVTSIFKILFQEIYSRVYSHQEAG